MSKQYETVIGLEVHVELATKTKIFCGCSTAFGGAPNTHTCPVCTGMPGSLPVLNKKVVEYAMAVGLATNCKITQVCKFERISELRLKKNVSEYQMSLDLGKNKSYIQSLTSGRSLPTMQSFLDICDYLEVTPQQFFDSELHNLPLIDKATDLMKQLDDEDMLALISMLNRLALKRK